MNNQLVIEIIVRDIRLSTAFYRRLGFELVADRGEFVELAWEGHLLFLDEHPGSAVVATGPQANVRIMVPDVDRYWALSQELGAAVVSPIADRDYGLRDFTICDPDGFGVRFGSRLPGWTAREKS